jgi:dTDP-4-amino-4,6-dideoxygalactose transaminase
VANGSVALELALATLDIGYGDEVIVPNRTFIASASCCVMRGATPVFADVDRDSQDVSLDTIKLVFTPQTKAIICVHLAGWACEMDEIIEFARKNNLFVIEDCSQALGGKYKGKRLGTMGDIGCFSFCQDKIMTTGGEGGMLVTPNEEWFRKAWSYKDHGKDFDFYINGVDKESYYTSLGTNWRMTAVQAAIGRAALKKVPRWLKKRRRFAQMLNEGLKEVPGIRLTIPPAHIEHTYYKFYIFIEPEKLNKGWDRDKIIDAVSAEGVPCQFGSTWGISQERGWKNAKLVGTQEVRDLRLRAHLPVDCELGKTSLMFQVHPTLDDQAIKDTIEAVKKVFAIAVK